MNEANTEVNPPKPISTVADLPKAWQPFAERAVQQEEAKPKRNSLLSTITTNKRYRPVFFCLYGPPGVGKSTFGASTDNPVFIPTERGVDHITVPKFPTPRTFIEFFNQLNVLDKEASI
jgi:hypothetical protein